MIGHEQARELASAAYDGELEAAMRPELDAHLASCSRCASFAAGLAPLTAAVAAVPRESLRAAWVAPLPEIVPPGQPHRQRRSWRLAPVAAVAAAVAVILLVTSGGAPVGFDMPAAGAATPLLELTDVYVEREVVTVRSPAGGAREVDTARERIWFSAPGLLRVETTRTGGSVTESTLLIERPGVRFTTDGGLVTGLPPSIALPEPLSPTLAELGRDVGPGPAVAGRPTRRIELAADGETRVALVDASRPYVLGSEQTVVLSKSPMHGPRSESVTKRVLSIDLSADHDPALFEPPVDRGTDAGFRHRPIGDLAAVPADLPRGFDVVTSGRGPRGDALLLARGALPVLVEITRTSPAEHEPSRTERVTVDGRAAVLQVLLYAPPRVRLAVGDQVVTVSAPIPTRSLIELAGLLYPSE